MICIYELTHELTTNGKEKKNVAMLKALTAVGKLMTLIDFTLSNARRFLLVNGEPLGRERVKH